MKKVVFFTEDGWAFGVIHHAVCKELFKYGIYGNVLQWSREYTGESMAYLNDSTDVFVTHPQGVECLEMFGIPRQKIISFAHGEIDLFQVPESSRQTYNELGGFAVMNRCLIPVAKSIGFPTIPEYVQIGIHTDIFSHAELPEKLQNIGYAAVKVSHNFFGIDIKRGHLVEEICEISKTNMILPNVDPSVVIAMRGFYKTVDAVIMSSIEETGGLPMLEAAAAGRLCIGTPVGYFEDHAMKGGGIMVGMEERQFVEESVRVIQYYQNNNPAFRKMCADTRQYAKDHYDWKYVIEGWVNLINRV